MSKTSTNPADTAPVEAETDAPDAAKFKTISLLEPIKRGETTISEVQLRKPKAGEMRGLKLQNLLTTDITSIMALLPRISEPTLTDNEVDQLDPADLAEFGGTIVGFFLSPSQRAQMEAMTATMN